eukprot:scaffold2061_cov415-Pavlova_lutheri.AAC.1
MGELWPFVTDVRRKTTGSRATSKEDCVAALLTNYHTCRYGGVANRYFDTLPPSMSEYRAITCNDTALGAAAAAVDGWMDGAVAAAAAGVDGWMDLLKQQQQQRWMDGADGAAAAAAVDGWTCWSC